MDKYWKKLAYRKTSIERCSSENIQFCGAIQSCSAVIVVDSKSQNIVAMSENFSTIIGDTIEPLLGKPLNTFPISISGSETRTAKDQPQILKMRGANGVDYIGYSSYSEDHYFIEFEELTTDQNIPLFDNIKQILASSHKHQDLDEMLKGVASTVRSITDFDRVMIYRFEPNLDGYVIAESKIKKLEPFLGLRYPESDIPPQARKLFYQCNSRSIADINDLPVPLLTKAGLAPGDIDLSASYFRATSPFHIEYLQNMGVTATLSIPIKIDNSLWGLIACHHYSGPKLLPFRRRSICELLGHLVNSRLSMLLNQNRLRIKNQILELSQYTLDNLTSRRSVIDSFREKGQQILDSVQSQGFIVTIGGESVKFGNTPPQDLIRSIVLKLNESEKQRIWTTTSLEQAGLPSHASAAGAMIVPLSADFQDFIVFFRPAATRTISWAGQPKRKTNAARLSPRGSFQLWKETIQNHSLEWSSDDLEAANYLSYSFVRDIFRRASELAEANVELHKATQSKDEFISMVSHELRTPLNAMLGWLEIAKDHSKGNRDFQKIVDTIDRNARVQINLINDLLDVSRIVSGKIRIQFQSNLSLNSIIGEVINDLRPTAATKKINIIYNCPDNFKTSGDPDRLRQVVWNLLSNAIKFSKSKSDIVIQAAKLASTYQITVADQGAGIPQEKLPFIFDRFSQVERSQDRSGGLGLGLSIVKALVELHGGQVIAQSLGANKGSTFIVTLPIYAVEMDKNEENANHPDSDTLTGKSLSLEGKHVLLAEDDQDSLNALKLILTGIGASVCTAWDGEQAFEKFKKAKKKTFDLILSDIGMPKTDGLDLIKQIRELERARRIQPIPAIALTAYAGTKNRTRCLEAGFQHHLPKPIEKQELFAVIRSLNVSGSDHG